MRFHCRLTHSGESEDTVRCYYYQGGTAVRNYQHYELVEPDVATLRYLDGGRVYTVYYDFAAQKHTLDRDTEKAAFRSDNGLENYLPRPDAEYVFESMLTDDYFSFYIYGWSNEDYDNYVPACKATGYTKNVREHEGMFSVIAKKTIKSMCFTMTKTDA